MRIMSSFLAVIFLISLAQAGQKHTIGTCESLFFGILEEDLRASSVYTFKTGGEANIKVLVEDFYYNDGYLTMHGKAQESENSAFMLKGDIEDLYGWVVLIDDNRAYEYSTDNNENVVVERVPFETVYSIDNFELPDDFKYDNEPLPEVPFKAGPPFPPHIGTYPGTNVNNLQSLPGAEKVIYLDISAMMNGDTPNPPQTKEDIWKNWQVVSAGYSAFQVNVTTDIYVREAAGVKNSGINRYIDSVGRSSCGMNIFGTSSSCTCYRDRGDGRPSGGMWTGISALSESGHMMGVSDCGGIPGGTYFEGFPRYKWVPVMGNFWHSIPWKEKALIQWSKGEYNTATAKQDFLAIVNKIIPYREDDIPETRPLEFTGGTLLNIENNFGQICPTGDSDGFTFEISESKGHVKLTIDRIECLLGAMLDVDASIQDESGNVILQHNADSARFASFDEELEPGKYTLIISGGAECTLQNGFSIYRYLGFYEIEGTITDGTEILNFKDLDISTKFFYVKANNKIMLDIPGKCKVEKITVYSLDGSTVFHTQSRVNSIDLSKFALGVYTINTAIDGSNLVRKIIKN